MGLYISIHIGAYLELKTEPIIDEITTIKCREHPNEEYGITDKYCALCGMELKTIVDKSTYIHPGYYQLFRSGKEEEKYEDVLHWMCVEESEDTLLLVGNEEVIDSPDYLENYGQHESGSTEVKKEIVEQYIQNFNNNHKEIITLLKPRVKSLKVKFGVLVDYS